MYRYFTNCVGWPSDDVWVDGGLSSLIESRQEITRDEFLSKVDRKDLLELEDGLGYVQDSIDGGLEMNKWQGNKNSN